MVIEIIDDSDEREGFDLTTLWLEIVSDLYFLHGILKISSKLDLIQFPKYSALSVR